MYQFFIQKVQFWPKKRALTRIGPHNPAVLSVLVGSLLGDGHADFQNQAVRFTFSMSQKHEPYVFWLHNFLKTHGYFSQKPPKLHQQVKKKDPSHIILITLIHFLFRV